MGTSWDGDGTKAQGVGWRVRGQGTYLQTLPGLALYALAGELSIATPNECTSSLVQYRAVRLV